MVPPCELSPEVIVMVPPRARTQEYWVGEPKAVYTFKEFSEEASYACESKDINYTHTVSPPRDFIELSGSSLSWSSADESSVGIYLITVTG
jgi:hypothetical protein